MAGFLSRHWALRLFERFLVKRLPQGPRRQLSHRCIFIVPTAAGAGFLLVQLLLLLLAINYQNSLIYALCFLLVAVFIVAIVHTWRNLLGLVLHYGGSRGAFAGEPVGFRVRLESLGSPHVAIKLSWQGTHSLICVPAGEAQEVVLEVASQRRGPLRPGRLRVESRFPLGLLKVWSWVDPHAMAPVYPYPLVASQMPRGALRSDGEHSGAQLQAGLPEDYRGLRSWQPGESMGRLHWKAFSRGRGLLVKDFASPACEDLQLDLAQMNGALEARLATLCHWVLTLSSQQQRFSMRLGGQQWGPDTGPAHQQACLIALALYGFSQEDQA